jgi:ABC-type multidrug transport system ATPase subunit
MADELIIETEGLTKSYGGVEALRGLDLTVPRGSIYGVLGRNGAGKTTTIKILLGMARPSGGTAKVFGRSADSAIDSVAIRARTGFVSDEKDLYDAMTVGEMVAFTAAFYPRWRADLEHRYLSRFALPVDRRVGALSRGMRAKLALLLALSRGAELLILDEPTSGLDPSATEEVLQALVGHVAGEEMTVFYSSHQIAEVEQISDHVAIVSQGRVAASGGLDDLRERYRRVQVVFDREAPPTTFYAPGVGRVRYEGRVMTVFASQGVEAVVAEARSMNPVAVDVLPVSLKDIFLETVAEAD